MALFLWFFMNLVTIFLSMKDFSNTNDYAASHFISVTYLTWHLLPLVFPAFLQRKILCAFVPLWFIKYPG